MKKFLSFSLLLLSLVLVSCNNKKIDLNEIIDDLSNILHEADNDNSVTNNLNLIQELENKDITIEWISSNNDVIDNLGNVYRKDEDIEVTIKLIVSYKESSKEKTFKLVVKGLEKHEVVFLIDGTKEEIKCVSVGSLVEKPIDPIKEGYSFIGWFYNDELYDFKKPILKDIKLVAKFEKDYEVITFEDLGTFNEVETGIYNFKDDVNIKYYNALSSIRDDSDYSIDGNGIIINGINDNSYLEIDFNSLEYLSFEYRKAFFNSNERLYKIDFIVKNKVIKSIDIEPFGNNFGDEEDVYTFELDNINILEEVTVKIYSYTKDDTSGLQGMTIDNIKYK